MGTSSKTQDDTLCCSKKHQDIQNKNHTRTTALARSVARGGEGGNSLYFVRYRRAAGIAPIFQVIYTSVGHDFISNIHL